MNFQDRLKEAIRAGREANKAGRVAAFAADPRRDELLRGLGGWEGRVLAVILAWNRGWHAENLSK